MGCWRGRRWSTRLRGPRQRSARTKQKDWTVEEDSLATAAQHGAIARAEGEMNDTDARLWHPWLRRINRVLRVMLQTRWRSEARAQVRVEFRRALALRSEIRRAGWFN